MHVKPFNINGEDKAKKAAEQLFSKPPPFNPPRILAAKEDALTPTAIAARVATKFEGTIACYQARENKYSLNIMIPTALYEAFGSSRIGVEYMGDNTWKIVRDSNGYAPFRKDTESKYKGQPYSAGIPGTPKFAATPAEFILTDNTILATLKEPPRIPAAKVGDPVRIKLPDAPVLKAFKATTIANTTTSPTTQLAALLEAIRTAERTTPYRLCKSKETGDWLFPAPPIK